MYTSRAGFCGLKALKFYTALYIVICIHTTISVSAVAQLGIAPGSSSQIQVSLFGDEPVTPTAVLVNGGDATTIVNAPVLTVTSFQSGAPAVVDGDWITVSPTGSFALLPGGSTRSITVGITPTKLVAGLYNASITISHNGFPATDIVISVSVQVKAGFAVEMLSVQTSTAASSPLSTIDLSATQLFTSMAENNGTYISYSVRPRTRSVGTITVGFASTPSTGITLSQASHTFPQVDLTAGTPASTVFNATVSDDSIASSSRNFSLVYTITSSDTSYVSSTTLKTLILQVIENDAAAFEFSLPGVSTGYTFQVTEGGSSQTVQMRLTSAPTAAVTVTFPTSTQLTFSPTFITKTSADWNVWTSFVISAVDDSYLEGYLTENVTFTRSHISSSDLVYVNSTIPEFNITIVDNDVLYESISPAIGIPAGATEVIVSLPISITFPISALGSNSAVNSLSTYQCLFADSFNFQRPVSATVTGDRTMKCSVPACIPGANFERCLTPVTFILIANRQVSTTNPSQYDYVDAPVLSSIAPDWGDLRETHVITIEGTNFRATTQAQCRIDSVLQTATSITSATSGNLAFTCVMPTRVDLAGSNDNVLVNVQVSINGQEFSNALKFAYFDVQKQFISEIWTIFFVIINLFLVVFVALMIKDCACKRQITEEEKKKVSEFHGPLRLLEILNADLVVAKKELADENQARHEELQENMRRQASSPSRKKSFFQRARDTIRGEQAADTFNFVGAQPQRRSRAGSMMSPPSKTGRLGLSRNSLGVSTRMSPRRLSQGASTRQLSSQPSSSALSANASSRSLFGESQQRVQISEDELIAQAEELRKPLLYQAHKPAPPLRWEYGRLSVLMERRRDPLESSDDEDNASDNGTQSDQKHSMPDIRQRKPTRSTSKTGKTAKRSRRRKRRKKRES
jgi:IPT/TIG domain